jgi:hypothetical protein
MVEDSIYQRKPGAIRDYVKRLANKSVIVPEAFSTYREIKVCPKKFRDMRVQTLADDPKELQEFVNSLTKGMQPESKYRLPYNKVEREKEMVESVAEVYSVDKNKAQSKVVTGHYKDPNSTQEFNYAVEVVVAPRKDLDVAKHAGEVEFVGNVNSTPSIDGGLGYFRDGPFEYKDKKGETQHSNSIEGVLYNSGFAPGEYHSKMKKKVPSVVMVNLKTPCPDWLGSAGKTKIDLNPYAGDIAKTVYQLTKKIPSYHPRKRTVIPDFNIRQTEAQDYLLRFLRQREKDIAADPSLLISDRLTQSGVWYRIRPIMIVDGFEPRKNWGTTRESLTASINKICKSYLGKSREELGIIAASRATMLYHGMSIPVSIDNVKGLARKGVVIIIIEKEGIADVLAAQARKYGVALVHTQGRLTEYGKDLIEAVKDVNGIVVILVDYDLVGHRIVRSSRTETPTIGINKDTMTWLKENGFPNLTIEDVEEEYDINLTSEDYLYEDKIDPYLRHHRIELDSIVAKVGANVFWKYIMHQMNELGPFDYTEEVSMPSYETLYTAEMADMITYLHEYTAGIVGDAEDEIIDNELSEVDELLEIETKEKEIQSNFEEMVSKDEGYKTISSEVKELLKRLPEPKSRGEGSDS